MAVGGGIKYFFKKSRSSNRFYLGSFADSKYVKEAVKIRNILPSFSIHPIMKDNNS
jgi:hypothetical protein